MVEAVDRTVNLIEQLAQNPGGIGVANLAKNVGLAGSTTHRYLAALQERGLVEQDEQKNYRLTPRLYLLGLSAAAGFDLERQARVSLERLTKQTGETSCLMIRDGRYSVCVAQTDAHHQLKIAARVGSRQDIRLGATSRLLLAYAPEEEREAILLEPAPRARTKKTVTDPKAIREILDEITEQGYYVSVGEVDEGVLAIAAPVRDRSAEVVAAIALAAPESRLGAPDVLEEAIALVVREAADLSFKLGFVDSSRLRVPTA
ncbi:MAG TPA: IclR family transcriptional regulator [Trueperaceae bacterium]